MVLRALCLTIILSFYQSLHAFDFQKSTLQILPNKTVDDKAGSKDSSNKDLKKPKKVSADPMSKSAVELKVELALTPQEQEQGLMYRKSLAPGEGMLFVFADERPRQFWMKNTLIPLSIAFIDEKKTIFQISELNPVKTLIQKTYDRAESVKPAKFVLEVPQGWFIVNKVGTGSTIVWKDEKKFLKKL